MPAPLLAFCADGTVVFANRAFAAMVGSTPEMLTSQGFHEIFETLPEDESPLAVVRARAHEIVELVHRDGWVVQARLSSMLVVESRPMGHDEVGLVMLVDVTEELWQRGR